MPQLPNLENLFLRSVSVTNANGECDYDPTVAGNHMQGYFADMLLDSDRNARYCDAIARAVTDFVAREGRAPVVLDAGCGTGLLTLFALVAGAERVISVDVNRGHVDKLLERLGPELASRCTPMHVGPPNPNPFASPTAGNALNFDMLVSELLGSFANGECASYYLAQYAQHMNVHPSGTVYCVPHTTTQTFRKVKLPRAVCHEIAGPFKHKYMGSDFVGFAYELLLPEYTGDAQVVREDRYGVYPFQTTLPVQDLDAGYYVAEWTAVLWPGAAPLRHTWEWAYTHNADEHSKHARSNQWGLMFFHVRTAAVANPNTTTVHTASPPLKAADGAIYTSGSGLSVEEEGADALRWLTPFNPKAVKINEQLQLRLDARLRKLEEQQDRGEWATVPVYPRYISMRAVCAGLPASVPVGSVYRMTVGALVNRICEQNGEQWMNVLDQMPILPFVLSEQSTSEFDVPVLLLPPQDALADARKRYRFITVGAGFRLFERDF